MQRPAVDTSSDFALLLAGTGHSLEVAGPAREREAEYVEEFLEHDYQLSWQQVLEDMAEFNCRIEVAYPAGAVYMGSQRRCITLTSFLQGCILLMSPKSLPAIEIPYMVGHRQLENLFMLQRMPHSE